MFFPFANANIVWIESNICNFRFASVKLMTKRKNKKETEIAQRKSNGRRWIAKKNTKTGGSSYSRFISNEKQNDNEKKFPNQIDLEEPKRRSRKSERIELYDSDIIRPIIQVSAFQIKYTTLSTLRIPNGPTSRNSLNDDRFHKPNTETKDESEILFVRSGCWFSVVLRLVSHISQTDALCEQLKKFVPTKYISLMLFNKLHFAASFKSF